MDDTLTERTHNYPLVTCPHCGREVPRSMVDMHASVCAHRPEMAARILAALTSDVDGVGVKMSVYERAAKSRGTPPVSTLLRNFGGTWLAVLESFGLDAPSDALKRRSARTPAQQRMTAKQREAAACEDVAQMAADARRVLAAEYDNAHTLHGYAVRDLPGVTVNGKPCVAVTLR